MAKTRVSPVPAENDIKTVSRRKRQRGQALVEFALILPIFMMIFMAVVDFGWALRAYVVEQNAAREGARYWALNGSPSGGCGDITTQVTNRAPTLSLDFSDPSTYQIDSVNTTTCVATSPKSVTVKPTYTYAFITPLLKAAFPSGIPMSPSATMRVE